MDATDPLRDWYGRHACTHAHCPACDCEHPQPFELDGELYCGRCAVQGGELVPCVPCTPEFCED